MKGIFGGYDIRGIYGDNFRESDALALGRAFGTFLQEKTGLNDSKKRKPRAVVGRDNRLSSPSLHSSFVTGLLATGCNVTDVGIVPTPVVYFSSFATKADGAAVITASHNPAQYNGVKMLNGIWPLSSEELLEVKEIFESRRFVEKPKAAYGVSSSKSALNDYIAFTSSKLPRCKGLKVVIDGGNGVVGQVGVKLLEKLGAEVIPLHCKPDGRYPNHLPDPSKPENLVDLQKTVLREKAGLGIAYDGDGDRAVFVDETGKVVKSDNANVLFIRNVLKKGGTVGFELRCSLVVKEEIEKLGGIPVETKAGRIAVRDSMRDGAVFACETTGHVCFADNNGFDDGIFASAKLAGIAAGSSVSKLSSTVKSYFATRELRIPCERAPQVIEKAVSAFKKKNIGVSRLDGLKYSDEGGWGLVRASQTEPLLSARFEGKTKGDLERVYSLFSTAISELPPLEKVL